MLLLYNKVIKLPIDSHYERQRITHFVHVFLQTAAVLATILTILSFFALGTVVVGFVRGLVVLIIFGLGILFIAGLLFIVYYSLLTDRSSKVCINYYLLV